MNSYERTVNFIQGKSVDRPPFHPIIMRWAAEYADIPYRDFCCDFKSKSYAYIKCAEDFDIDWVTVMSDAYCEAVGFGLKVEFPENDLPLETGGHLPDLDAVANLKRYDIHDNPRIVNTIHTIEEFRKNVGGKRFILGWVEGPIAEYGDIRGLTNAAMDFYDNPEAVHHAMDVILEVALDSLSAQIKAGADCIGIGDAFCSQIGPAIYKDFAFQREKILVDRIHELGAFAKLHICGNTSTILPDMIKTGADIIDVDHLVGSMEPFHSFLSPTQVFSGNCDPVEIIQNSSLEEIKTNVQQSFHQSKGRTITSAGCEITPGTSQENFKAFRDFAKELIAI